MRFLLPHHPTLLCIDRFDLESTSDDLQAPFWAILSALLRSPVKSSSDLIDQLESLSVALRGASNTDYGFLRTFLEEHWPSKERFFERVWPAAVKLALE